MAHHSSPMHKGAKAAGAHGFGAAHGGANSMKSKLVQGPMGRMVPGKGKMVHSHVGEHHGPHHSGHGSK